MKFTGAKKEYLCLSSRFLKEIGLYDLWIQYIYQPNVTMSWTKKSNHNLIATDILGCTCFTDYVREHRPKAYESLKGYCVYEVFGEFIRKMNIKDQTYNGSYDVLNVDKDKKRVTLRDYVKIS